MPFIAAPNIVSVELRCRLDGQGIENRFTIDALTTPTPTIVDDICNLVSVWAQGTYFDHIPDAVQLIEVVATDLSASDGVQHTIVPEGTVVGGLAGVVMPNEVTFCVTHKSASRGRSARGRSYVLALNKASVTSNTLDSGLANSFVSDFDALRDVMTDQGYSWVVVSYRHDNAVRPGGPVYYPITGSSYADLIVDSMKRRKPGVGT